MIFNPQPECEAATVNGIPMHNLNRNPSTGDCIMCCALIAAYKRGREDAAKDSGAYIIGNLDTKQETADFLDGVYSAARGGEQ